MAGERDGETTEALVRALELEGAERDRFLLSLEPSLREELLASIDEGGSLVADPETTPRLAACGPFLRHLLDSLAEGGASGSALGDAAPGGLDPRRVVGKYRVVRLVGEGGMGCVFEAEDMDLRRPVALKTPRGPSVMSGDREERVLDEARALARLEHPHPCVVTVYDVFEHGGTWWIAEELVPSGRTLAELIDESGRSGPVGRAAVRRLASIFEKVAGALAYAHQNGVVHRDVKPANILLDAQDNPKITDFGLALHGRPAAREQRISRRSGTPEYMSPEQLRGGEIDHRTAIWSLGVCLYEALHGCRPFRGQDRNSVLSSIERGDLSPGPDARRRLDRRLRCICQRALRRDRKRCYGSMEELAADLRRFLAPRVTHLHAALIIAMLAISSVALVMLRAPPHAQKAEFLGLECWAVSASVVESWLGLLENLLARRVLRAVCAARQMEEDPSQVDGVIEDLEAGLRDSGRSADTLGKDASWILGYLKAQRAMRMTGEDDREEREALLREAKEHLSQARAPATNGEEVLLDHDVGYDVSPGGIRFNLLHPLARFATVIGSAGSLYKGGERADYALALHDLGRFTERSATGAVALLLCGRVKFFYARSYGDALSLVDALGFLNQAGQCFNHEAPQIFFTTLGQVQLLLHNDAQARSALGKALARPGDGRTQNVYCALGTLEARAGDWEQSRSYLVEAEKLRPDDVYVHLALAEMSLALNRLDEARDHAARAKGSGAGALEHDQRFASAQLMLARIAAREEDWRGLADHLCRLVGAVVHPHDLAMGCVLVAALPAAVSSGDLERTQWDLYAAANGSYSLGPRPPVVLSARGAACLVRGRPGEARDSAQQALEERSRVRRALRSERILRNDRWGLVYEAMDRYVLARAYQGLGEAEKARESLDSGDMIREMVVEKGGLVEYLDIVDGLRARAREVIK
ncbi:MAG: protein kinase [Planctomycetes bacterium]|nr:protein kinase [Planctomycetota bacterium]